MITFKCKMCGGDLTFEPGASVAECPYCGTNQTLPKLDDDKRANLYDRANHFRRQNEFDKAMAIYEQILAEDRTDAEAYWSLVLCRYGIEYVEDPASHKRVPTVNRVQYATILADEDYKSALQYADAQQRSVYESEANAIAEIQKGILDISRKEAPFDVFICYKETDANGRRTPDSVLANDMYHQLTKEGFKVFFSRITLEDKIGTAYEPYIFAALNSAKVMVVLGTKPEYFGAVWVKNEWSRYLALIRNGADKTLVPAYRDMDPYDLPEEFAHLQAQDMGKLGFMQDLIRGIKKILHKDEPKPQTVAQPTAAVPANNVAPLLKRAFMFLEDGDFARADDFCEQVLNIDPENGRAYLGKLMVDLQVRRESDLKNHSQPFDGESNYQKIMRFGDEALKNQIKSDIGYINNRNEHYRQKAIFDNAVLALHNAETVEQCQDVEKQFASISGFEGVTEKLMRCDEKIERIKAENYQKAIELKDAGKWDEAIDILNLLGDYLDSRKQMQMCKTLKKTEQLEADKRQELNKRIEKEIAEKHRRKTIFVVGLVSMSLLLGIVYIKFIRPISIREIQYQKACKLKDDGHYDDAFAIYATLRGYKDVNNIIENDEKIKVVKIAWLEQFNVGNTVQLGRYEQDNDSSNGEESIEWIVLANDGETATLISKYGLAEKYYNESSGAENVTWEKCSLRKWLNGTFKNKAFTMEEKRMLQMNKTIADMGNDTSDLVYLLSYSEVIRYFSSRSERICIPTKTAFDVDKEHQIIDGCRWWLRTPGSYDSGDYSNLTASVVNADGSIKRDGLVANVYTSFARPVIGVKLI